MGSYGSLISWACVAPAAIEMKHDARKM